MADADPLLQEIKDALQKLGAAEQAYHDGARLAPTGEDEINLWRPRREARKALQENAPEWLALLVERVTQAEQERDKFRSQASVAAISANAGGEAWQVSQADLRRSEAEVQRLRGALLKIACHENAYHAECVEYAITHHGAHRPECTIAVEALKVVVPASPGEPT